MLLYSVIPNRRHRLPVRSVVVLLRSGANVSTMTGVVELRHAPTEPLNGTHEVDMKILFPKPNSRAAPSAP